MAIRADGKYYVEDSTYGDQGAHYNSTDRVQNLPGNTLDTVPVESRLFVYLKTFEEFVAQNPKIQYRNLAEYGASVKGVPYQTFGEALDWIDEGDSKVFADSLTDLFGKQCDEIKLEEIFSPTTAYVEKLFEATFLAAMKRS